VLLDADQHTLALEVRDDVHHNGEASLQWFAIGTKGVHAEGEVISVVHRLAPGGDDGGEVVVEALLREPLGKP
jgi:hypothetical protein